MRYAGAALFFLCMCPLVMPSGTAQALTGEQSWQLASVSERYKAAGQRLFKSMEALKSAAKGRNAQLVDALQKEWEGKLDSLIVSTMLKDNVSLAEAAARCSDERSAWAEGVLAGRVRLDSPALMPQTAPAPQYAPVPSFRGSASGLLEACTKGDLDKVRLNVESRVDINSRDAEGNTPLILATLGGKADIVEYLLSMGADWRVKNSKGYPAAAFINDANADRILAAFLRSGLDVNQAFGSDGRTILHNAARSGYGRLAALLLSAGQNPDVRDNDRETPLHYLAYATDKEKIDRLNIARLFVQAGANIDARNKNNRTPLYLAVKGKCQQSALALIQCGANVNQTAGRGSILYYAVDQELYDVAGELIRRGASQDVPGDDWKGMYRTSPGKLLELQKRGYLR